MATPDPADMEPDIPEAPVICAWCKTVLNVGAGPPSHGVCPTCLVEELKIELVDFETLRRKNSDVA